MLSCSAVITPIPESCSASIALRSSGPLIAAVPSLPTTSPAARFAIPVASARLSPAASAEASTEITVSPAPVTSNTSRARAGKCNSSESGSSKVIPCSPRVMSMACNSRSLINLRPFLTSSSSFAQVPTTASNSLKFGVIRVEPRYFLKSVPFGSTMIGIFCFLASSIRAATSCNAPFA